jgi:hypothetical protein
MNTPARLARVLSIAYLVTSAAAASASSPTAVKIKPTHIEYQPTAAAPERIIVHGAASLWSQTATCRFGVMPGHPPPTCGVYLYYQCPAAQLEMCRVQWKDIERARDQGVTASFGDLARPPRLRAEGEAPAAPDEYTLAYGVFVGEAYYCSTAEDWLCPAAATPDAGVPPASVGTPDAAPMAKPQPSPDAGTPSTPATSKACAYGGSGGAGSLPLVLLLVATRLRRRRR